MRRLLRVARRRFAWSLVRPAAGGIACYLVLGLMIAGVGTRSVPALTVFDIMIGLVLLDAFVAFTREWIRARTVLDMDDQFDIKFMRPLPTRLRTLLFALCVPGFIAPFLVIAIMARPGVGQQLFATLFLAGQPGAWAILRFGKGLAERALLREKADRLRIQQRMAEVAKARASREAREAERAVPDFSDAAVRRRFAQRTQ